MLAGQQPLHGPRQCRMAKTTMLDLLVEVVEQQPIAADRAGAGPRAAGRLGEQRPVALFGQDPRRRAVSSPATTTVRGPQRLVDRRPDLLVLLAALDVWLRVVLGDQRLQPDVEVEWATPEHEPARRLIEVEGLDERPKMPTWSVVRSARSMQSLRTVGGDDDHRQPARAASSTAGCRLATASPTCRGRRPGGPVRVGARARKPAVRSSISAWTAARRRRPHRGRRAEGGVARPGASTTSAHPP